ncbi:MAG: hypothetical protein WDO74_16175 [Pseudomonadota bacterium]
MKTCNLSLATVVLGALAVSYSACSAEGQDNAVPGGPAAHAGSVSSGGSVDSAGSASFPTAGKSGAANHPNGGSPATTGGGPNTGVGGATTSGGAHHGGGPGAGGGPTGTAGGSATGACKAAAGTITDLLIDDLDDGDDAIRPIGARVGYWYTFNDGTGVQVPAPTVAFKGTTPGHIPAAGLAATTSGPAFTSYGAGMGFDFNNTAMKACPYNAGAYTGIKFWAKANTGNMAMMALSAMVKIPATTAVANGGTCVGTCDDHYALKPAPVLTMAWTQYTITFASAATFAQGGFGTAAPFDKTKILAVQFQVAKNVKFNFSVDDVTFF